MKSTTKAPQFSTPKLKLGHRIFDKLGVLLSLICGFHCLVAPFVIVAAPWLSTIFGSESFHSLMLFIVIPVALLSVVQNNGFKGLTPRIMLIGVFFLILGVVTHSAHHEESIDHSVVELLLENLFTMVGGAFLFYGHLRRLKKCESPHSH